MATYTLPTINRIQSKSLKVRVFLRAFITLQPPKKNLNII